MAKKKTATYLKPLDKFGDDMKAAALLEYIQVRALLPKVKLLDYIRGVEAQFERLGGSTIDEALDNYFNQLPTEIMANVAESQGWDPETQLGILQIYMDETDGEIPLADFLKGMLSETGDEPADEAGTPAESAEKTESSSDNQNAEVPAPDAEPASVSSTPFEPPADGEQVHEQTVEVTAPLTATIAGYLELTEQFKDADPEAVLHTFRAVFSGVTAILAITNGKQGPWVDAYLVDSNNEVLAECETTKELFQDYVFRGEKLDAAYVVKLTPKESEGPATRPRSRETASS